MELLAQGWSLRSASIEVGVSRSAGRTPLPRPLQPGGAVPNWLPTPAGRFKFVLRAYLPGTAIMDGT
jgi:hypothetical protein